MVTIYKVCRRGAAGNKANFLGLFSSVGMVERLHECCREQNITHDYGKDNIIVEELFVFETVSEVLYNRNIEAKRSALSKLNGDEKYALRILGLD